MNEFPKSARNDLLRSVEYTKGANGLVTKLHFMLATLEANV